MLVLQHRTVSVRVCEKERERARNRARKTLKIAHRLRSFYAASDLNFVPFNSAGGVHRRQKKRDGNGEQSSVKTKQKLALVVFTDIRGELRLVSIADMINGNQKEELVTESKRREQQTDRERGKVRRQI